MSHGLDRTRESKGIPALMLFVVAAILAPAIFVAARGGGLSPIAAGVVAGAIVIVSLILVRRRVPNVLGSGRGAGWLFALWMVLSLTSAYRLAHLSVYMFDSHRTEYAMTHTIRDFDEEELEEEFLPKHNCFTCYIIATHLADEGAENIYERKQYRNPQNKTPIHETIGDLHTIDTYQYPPPFLLLPKLLMSVGKDFFACRSIWFGLNVLAFTLTAVLLAQWLSGNTFGAFWFAIPGVWLASSTLATLQIGNVHLLIITLSVLGMLLLEKNRHVLGGALLGFVIVSKIFPGVLLVYLVFRRKWKAAVTTGVAMIAFCLLTLLIFGQQPFRAFVDYQWPRLSSGEAFWFARESTRAITVNSSLFGMIYKLSRLDLLGELDPNRLTSLLMPVYTGVLLLILALSGHQHRNLPTLESTPELVKSDRLKVARMWFVILVLAQLRSPFLPWEYGNFVTFWLLALLIPRGPSWAWKTAGLILLWIMYAQTLPLPFGPLNVQPDLVLGLIATIMTLAICTTVALKCLRSTVSVSAGNS